MLRIASRFRSGSNDLAFAVLERFIRDIAEVGDLEIF